MKRTLRKLSALILIICLAVSFSSCSLFATMREYSQKASEIDIIPTPEDEAMYAQFEKALGVSAADALKIGESSSYDVKNISVLSGEEKAGLLDKAAGTLNKMILANNPGKESKDIEPASFDGTLLESFDTDLVLSYTASRNTVNEAVTNEKGEEVTDEEGTVVRELKIKDNFMHTELLFYNDTIVEEAYTDENGDNVDAVTERTFAEADVIEKVFGSPADKAAVLAQFDAVKDYITVNDYSCEYGTCKVSSEIDLDTDRLTGVTFEKNILVTASVTGKGIFEDYGELTVTFNVIKTNGYSFTYPEPED